MKTNIEPPLRIDTITGDATIYVGNGDPEIPSGQERECPQCKRLAWSKTRHCWNCGWDFEQRCARLKRTGFGLAILLLLGMAHLCFLLKAS